MKSQKGFTLIEVIIYIALFSLLIGTAFVTAFQLIDGSGKLSAKNTVQEEGNFMMRKIDWALTGLNPTIIPTISGLGSEVTVNKYDGVTNKIVKIKLGSGVDAGKILMDDTGSFLPITTDNVQVISLVFTPTGGTPPGITATAKINGLDFTITKYIRK